MQGGGTSGTVRSGQTTTVDPTQQAINTHALNELRAGQKATGGMAEISKFQPLALYGQEEQNILRGLVDRAGMSLMRPEESTGLNTLRDLYTRASARPQDHLDLARDYFRTITAPDTMARMTATGYGSSGALNEALARGGAELSLPVYSMSEANRYNAGNRYADASMALGPMFEERDLARRYEALEAAGAPRVARLNEILRPQQSYFSFLSGLPIVTGSSTTGKQRSVGSNWNAGIGLSFCRVAEALWGKDSAKTLYARYYITTVQPRTVWGRMARYVYGKIGKYIAKTPLRYALRGILSQCAERGRVALLGTN